MERDWIWRCSWRVILGVLCLHFCKNLRGGLSDPTRGQGLHCLLVLTLLHCATGTAGVGNIGDSFLGFFRWLSLSCAIKASAHRPMKSPSHHLFSLARTDFRVSPQWERPRLARMHRESMNHLFHPSTSDGLERIPCSVSLITLAQTFLTPFGNVSTRMCTIKKEETKIFRNAHTDTRTQQ